MSQPNTFSDTVPAPRRPQGQPQAARAVMTPAEAAAFEAGRAYQEPISVLQGSRMGRLSWFCLGTMVGIATVGTLVACGVAP